MSDMNILCATDRNFLNPTYVTLYSILCNHRSINVNIYLLAGEDIEEGEKNKLKEFIESEGGSIYFLNVNESQYSNFEYHERFTKVAYFRLMAHAILPQSLDRILYLDVDIVVNKPIYDDLYNIDFKDKYLVATSHNPDPSFYNTLDKKLVNLEAAAKGEYFNSGVILINLEKMRQNITIESYKSAYASCERKGIRVFYDQGLLNYMFFDKTIYLSSMDFNYRYSIPKDYAKRLQKNRVYKKAIIHYTGMKQPYKPWDLLLTEDEIKKFGEVPYESKYFYVNMELHNLMMIWWQYAKNTPVYPQIVHDMEIKTKWFRRNLMEFMLAHNKIIHDSSKQ